MKRIVLFLLVGLPMMMLAQNIVLPDKAKDDLKKVKKSKGIKTKNEVKEDAKPEDKYSITGFTDNFLEVRLEYVLQYKNGDDFITLAKDDNSYFGYNLVYGVAADGMLWLSESQMKPWLEDEEYKLYKNDTLIPSVSKVLIRNFGKSDFDEVKAAGPDINVLNKHIYAYKLEGNVESFKISYSDGGETWIMAIDNSSEFGSEPEFSLFSIGNLVENDLKSELKKLGDDDEYSYAVILHSEEDFKKPELSDVVTFNGSTVDVEDVIYKKSLKVIGKETNASCEYCCDEIDKFTSKKEYKEIIKKWEESIAKAKEDLKYEKDEGKSTKLNKQISACEAKLKEHKKGFLGIKF